MSSSTFKSHFNMISMNEPVQHKAKFWTAYVRALKGTDDMRANDDNTAAARRRQRPGSEAPVDLFPRLFDDVPSSYGQQASSRIQAPGYKYLPVSRDTYGYSPRATSASPTPVGRSYHTRK